MARDVRGEKVEKFKLTKEMKTYSTQIKKAKRIGAMLQGATMMAKMKAKTMEDLWRKFMVSYEGLQNEVPEEQLREIHKMDFGPQEEERAPGTQEMLQQGPMDSESPRGAIRY